MHILAHKDNEKNNETYEQGEPNNGGVQHYQLQRSRYLPCPLKLHIDPSDTKATDKRQNHHCSTVSLSEPDQPQPVSLLECVPRLPPSPKYIWFRGLQQSECRFCFFIADECEDFIHFSFLDFLRNRSIRQGFCQICYP